MTSHPVDFDVIERNIGFRDELILMLAEPPAGSGQELRCRMPNLQVPFVVEI
jgi:hypothetical protein